MYATQRTDLRPRDRAGAQRTRARAAPRPGRLERDGPAAGLRDARDTPECPGACWSWSGPVVKQSRKAVGGSRLLKRSQLAGNGNLRFPNGMRRVLGPLLIGPWRRAARESGVPRACRTKQNVGWMGYAVNPTAAVCYHSRVPAADVSRQTNPIAGRAEGRITVSRDKSYDECDLQRAPEKQSQCATGNLVKEDVHG